MFNCSQYCWINWNDAALYFKRLFHIGVWTFARFVRPLVATILLYGKFWSVPVTAYTCTTYVLLVGKQYINTIFFNASPQRYLSRALTRNLRLFLALHYSGKWSAASPQTLVLLMSAQAYRRHLDMSYLLSLDSIRHSTAQCLQIKGTDSITICHCNEARLEHDV